MTCSRESQSCSTLLCVCNLLSMGVYFLLFLFSEERNDWISLLLNALKLQALSSQSQAAIAPEKCGYLELRGYKAKIFTVLSGNSVWLCKNEQVSHVTVIADCGPLQRSQTTITAMLCLTYWCFTDEALVCFVYAAKCNEELLC